LMLQQPCCYFYGNTFYGIKDVYCACDFLLLYCNRDVALRIGLSPPSSSSQTLPQVRLSTKLRGHYHCLFTDLERHSQQLLHGAPLILCTHFLRRRTFCVKPVGHLSVYLSAQLTGSLFSETFRAGCRCPKSPRDG
jgi:hypothetical protein